MHADTDVIVIGAGIAGLATAARLQARGLSTLTLEAHGQVGGCAGFYRRAGFSFDVGATTLVDFGPDGVGGQFLADIGLPPVDGEILPAYQAWLPDRTVTLHRDPAAWGRERLTVFGDSPGHRRFWNLLDRLAATFWAASRGGIRLPLRSPADLARTAALVPPAGWPLARYARWTVGDALRSCGLTGDRPLQALLGMLLEDTVHAPVATAPLINGALGITIRGAGLTRPRGGMRGFWEPIVTRYRVLGGVLRVGTRVDGVDHDRGGYAVHTRRGTFRSPSLVSTLPIWDTARIGPPAVAEALRPYLRRDEAALGGAAIACLGVPEEEVAGQDLTHHQILPTYDAPVGNGNNLFVSVSAAGDTASAPPGWRAVMISTHCNLADWEGLSEADDAARTAALTRHLIDQSRRVYPRLGDRARVREVGTPRTYAAYTGRYRGSIGGIRLTLHNSNQHAVPYDLGIPGFWQAGDTTWPGLGTVACLLGSRHVAEAVLAARAGRSSGFLTRARRAFPPRDANRRGYERAQEAGHALG